MTVNCILLFVGNKELFFFSDSSEAVLVILFGASTFRLMKWVGYVLLFCNPILFIVILCFFSCFTCPMYIL